MPVLRILFSVFLFCAMAISAGAQSISHIGLDHQRISFFQESNGRKQDALLPLLEFEINGKVFSSIDQSGMEVAVSVRDTVHGVTLDARVTNVSRDTISLANVIPFGRSQAEVFITGKGDHPLSRSHLFLPGKSPLNVILPDNAWHLGYASVKLNDQQSVWGLVRRDPNALIKATRRRFETIIAPGGSVTFQVYVDAFSGAWQEGLREVFQNRHLFDVKNFDDAMYRRSDLKWIQSAYVMHLMMAWDKDYYDIGTGRFGWEDFMRKAQSLYGGDDVLCVWPTWPSLGLDPRNQFDLYRDLPGGLPQLRKLADTMRSHRTKLFIAYNPWDGSTRSEGHLQGLASLIQSTTADGVVLDTKGESSRELQQAADQVRPGVIMYSEGMAVPRDMVGIVSGRVHNALYYPPVLNLNKLIRPDFAIFRVAEVYKEPIRREYALSFFNGYGTEINQFAPGHPSWEEEQYRYLGKTTRILRENHSNFVSFGWTPAIEVDRDSVWINEWPTEGKVLYTVYSTVAQGIHNAHFHVTPRKGFHFVDLWHHTMLIPEKRGEGWSVTASTHAFDAADLGTNNEGEVDCIAQLPDLISVTLTGSVLSVHTERGDEIRVWKGEPSYGQEPLPPSVFTAGMSNHITPTWSIDRYEGKLVVQVLEHGELLDETIVELKAGTPRLINIVRPTKAGTSTLKDEVRIPAGKFVFHTTHGDDFIPYPVAEEGSTFETKGFWMDKYPVTNQQYYEFLVATRYKPSDTANFLKHWNHGKFNDGEAHFPVVYVSYEDANAFAQWAGKRLPTEREWQYAAQAGTQNDWPWPQAKPVTRKEQVVTETLTVTALEGINPKFCNLGDGKLYAVGKYRAGANPLGLQDLTGCVWQLTNDVYESGSYRYIIMKGGSYFKPSSSWWYVQGGPRELHYRQYLLRVSQGFERNATVGFRCVKD